MNTEQISVEILNRRFTIGTPESERQTLLKAVDLLNQKIRAIQSAGRNMETEKVIIMAALNLTHDLLRNNQDNKKPLSNEADSRRIMSIIELCENALKTN